MRSRDFLTVMAIGLAVAGCSTTNERVSKALASGAVGCPTDEVQIENETATGKIHNFTAVCKGQRYACSYMYPNPIACKEQR